MKKNIILIKKDFSNLKYEFIERKGLGHPDTLADALAETLSVEYSKYTLDKFGAILHHNFDKVGLLGGSSSVSFGKGSLTSPIRVLINGRVSTKFGRHVIPYERLIKKWTKEFFLMRLPIINVNKDLLFHFNISNQSSPGKTENDKVDKASRKYWFEPRGLFDLQELARLFSNDTSLGVGYSPSSKLENLILKIESILNSQEYQQKNKWIGSDIKIMGVKILDDVSITMCIPQVSKFVKDINQYKINIDKARNDVLKITKKYGFDHINLYINTRDNYDRCELYLTATGSSIESGDEGLVGRGNRVGGAIASQKPYSMEGVCGKNPVYHIGKIYSVAAKEISKKIYKKYKIHNETYLVSQSGRNLVDPWYTLIITPNNFDKTKELEVFVKSELLKIPKLTKDILEKKFIIY
ncbi:MAG: methionine adenosyltransferase [Candidatus Pacebacteria bacterium]|nr:methionine adenosyltransferase [Candidatus Paceibacterota bacterium]